MAAGIAEGFLSAGVAGFAALLLVVAIAAWRRVGGQKLLGLAAAFAVFLVKGLWYSWQAFGPGQGALPIELLALDFGILLLLYVGTVR
jgi:hypothetical protein